MQNINIGKSGIAVPFLGMGTWAIGGGAWWGDNDDALSVKAIQTAVEQGIQWIDTAPIYGLYHSEEVVGEAIYPSLYDGAQFVCFDEKGRTLFVKNERDLTKIEKDGNVIKPVYYEKKQIEENKTLIENIKNVIEEKKEEVIVVEKPIEKKEPIIPLTKKDEYINDIKIEEEIKKEIEQPVKKKRRVNVYEQNDYI